MTFYRICQILLKNIVTESKKVPKGFWIDEITFLTEKLQNLSEMDEKKKGFRKLEKSYQKRGFGPGVRLG